MAAAKPVITALQKEIFEIGCFAMVGGLVKELEDNASGKVKKFPACLQSECLFLKERCEGDNYVAFGPGEAVSMVYFEFVEEGVRNGNSNRILKIRLVAHWNSRKLSHDEHAVSLAVAKAISHTNGLVTDNVTVQSIAITSISENSSVFKKYSYSDAVNQFTMHPYRFLVFELTINYILSVGCLEKITIKE